MQILATKIPHVLLIEPEIFEDERGFFMEIYREERFVEEGITPRFVQNNHSGSTRGVLRGLHYQIDHAQGKIARVIVGEIFDVAVDLRRSSSTFGQWVGMKLSAENRRMLWIPPGFAHGLYVLSDWAEVLYKVNDYYAPEYERILIWNDPEVGIEWPLEDGQMPILSEKDRQGKRLEDLELFD
jgi:dTDP-4-dehydrorhamnose 3,5-epimerase